MPDLQDLYRRYPRLTTGIGVLLLVVIVVIVVASVAGRGGSTPPQHTKPGSQTTTPAAHTSTQEATEATKPGDCPALSGGPAGTRIPTSAPSHVDWVTVGAMQVPQAPTTIGPARTEDGFGVCYAHTPTGALLAAMGMVGALSKGPYKEAVRTLAYPDAARAADLAKNGSSSQTLSGQNAETIQGFKIVSYTPAYASIKIATEVTSAGQLLTMPFPVKWTGTDWKAIDQYPGGNPVQISSLSGFVDWSASGS